MSSREGVAIKVKIGLKANGHALYPNWGLLPMVQGGTTPESQQIVKWKYDKSSGHDEDDGGDSPVGTQWGMMIVTEQFANEAVAMFPAVSIVTEVEAETFWNDKAYSHLDDDIVSVNALQGLLLRLDALERAGGSAAEIAAMKAKIKNSENPNHSAAGVKKNKTKYFNDAKVHLGFTIKP